MTEPNPRNNNLTSVIFDMEEDVRKVKRWGAALRMMGPRQLPFRPEALSVIADALFELGLSIGAQYNHVFGLSRPGGESRRGQPCA